MDLTIFIFLQLAFFISAGIWSIAYAMLLRCGVAAGKYFQQNGTEPKKARKSLLDLPSEVRIAVYAALLPPNGWFSEIKALRATCCQVKVELESEFARRVTNHIRNRTGPLPLTIDIRSIGLLSHIILILPIADLNRQKGIHDYRASLTYRLLDAMPSYIDHVTIAFSYNKKTVPVQGMVILRLEDVKNAVCWFMLSTQRAMRRDLKKVEVVWGDLVKHKSLKIYLARDDNSLARPDIYIKRSAIVGPEHEPEYQGLTWELTDTPHTRR
ncbi:uncharacterized protein K460DRAFT_361005 [Cucurbitaria berberidis CBS 394.84]|uniref:Uncharacterized protein n=1 Tax=Cucurbitaria berberidis CBS 394.84 TaxID=1168544 RepID=A0A9P4GRT4_9PLEO|nr:uncharacterized protein K460DRAFT_361005 [Cucurbitaria berberidis CBS 394.84]KAF1850180.1 hypothetical protein K460DRAFT_361005 [Cucurbitaria berberidis CBS 394.84]